jgi:hypothetical protein
VQLPHYLGLLHRAECELARAYREVGEAHRDEPDVEVECNLLAGRCEQRASDLRPVVERYGEADEDEPDRLHTDLFQGSRSGGLGLLRDLHDLLLMATECELAWAVVGQAAQGCRDDELVALVEDADHETSIQLAWLRTRLKQAAPQALVVA